MPPHWDSHRLTEMEIWQIAIDWIRFNNAKTNSQEQFDTYWAHEKELNLLFDEHYEDLWRLILVIHSLDKSPTIKGLLSAGPIENLLGAAGEQFIDRVEIMARFDPSFAKVLGGVWKYTMSDEVWARLQKVWDRRGWDGIPE
jgi:hypothetical protein